AHIYYIFFFQAEDGIRARNVTGVQTCALPILRRPRPMATSESANNAARPAPVCTAPTATSAMVAMMDTVLTSAATATTTRRSQRSEERRVGKEGRGGRAPGHGREKESIGGEGV